jgi:hypothetical protein
MSPEHREKLEEVRRTTQSALLHRLIQMIDSMPLEDWAVYALTIMTEDNARLRDDLMSKDRETPRVMIKGTFEIKTDITEP